MKAILAGFVALGIGAGVFYLFKTGIISFKSKSATVSAAPTAALPVGDPKLIFGSTNCDDQGCNISVAISVYAACHVGDFNLMKLDLLEASDKPSFLVSVEPLLLGESSVTASSQVVTLKEAEAGVVKTFRLPRFQRPTQLGVFLCKDSKNEQKCAGKEVKDFNAMMGMIFKGKQKGGKYRSPDHMYFFQYVIWEEEGRIAAMNDENPQMMTDELYASRLNYLMARSPQFPLERQQTMDKIKAISQSLRSIPFDIKGAQITIRLPNNDPNCKKE